MDIARNVLKLRQGKREGAKMIEEIFEIMTWQDWLFVFGAIIALSYLVSVCLEAMRAFWPGKNGRKI
jgi:hypothetical protein